MKKLGVLLAVLIVLSLLVVATVPASADKPGRPPGQEKEKAKTLPGQEKQADEKPGTAPPGQRKKGDDEPERVPPEQEKKGDDPRPGSWGQAKMTICHKPGTPAEKTLVVATPAVSAHLVHGDTLGPCPQTGEPEPPPIVPSAVVTITLCHKPGAPAEKTLAVAATAKAGHLVHGDSVGPCPVSDAETLVGGPVGKPLRRGHRSELAR
jgi:hypothetical protein